VSQPEWQEVVTQLKSSCQRRGLDLTHAFNVRQYNAQAAENERLSDFGRTDALGVLVGNTRALWPAFKQALTRDFALSDEQHPLDTYVTQRLTALVAEATSHAAQIVFSHVTSPRAFPIQRLAEAVEFAAVSPSHLSVHAELGPWFALRAVVVFDLPGPDAAPPALARPCRGCSAPCVPALARAVAASGSPLSAAAIAEHAAEWVAVRDVCPVGRSFRYDDEQLRYHYVKAPLKAPP
jgi:methylmalonic aciduria homocystinuria type C protein